VFEKCGQFGLLASRIGPGPHLKGFKLPGGVTAEEFDYFHELIAHEEMAAMGFPGTFFIHELFTSVFPV
jgi:hypothetical protein